MRYESSSPKIASPITSESFPLSDLSDARRNNDILTGEISNGVVEYICDKGRNSIEEYIYRRRDPFNGEKVIQEHAL